MESAFQQMRQAMVAQDWELGAVQHAGQYEQWRQKQQASGMPVTPPGPWYVTEIMMPQLGQAMMSGHAASAAADKAVPVPNVQALGSTATSLAQEPRLSPPRTIAQLVQDTESLRSAADTAVPADGQGGSAIRGRTRSPIGREARLWEAAGLEDTDL